MNALDRLREHWQQQNLEWSDTGPTTAAAQAPGHSSKDRSVTFLQIEDRVLMNSFADEKDDVLTDVGLATRDLFDNRRDTKYHYSDGRVVTRTPDKKFLMSGGMKGKTNTALFRAEKLADHPTGLPVFVTEGEQDVLALESIGATAVSGSGGVGKAHIHDWSPLTGHTVVVIADKDEDEKKLRNARKHATEIYEILAPIAEAVVIVESPYGKDAADHILAGHTPEEFVPVEIPGSTYGARRLRITLGSDVKTRRVQWIMQDWIPSGSLTLLAGREGLGKSTIAAAMCAAVTQGTTDGELQGQPRNIIYIHTEDAREFTVAPRLQAAGADMNRVLFVDVQTDVTDDGTLILPLDVHALEKVIIDHEVAFIVLDAATSSMSSELSGKDDRAVRQYLEPLSQLAGRRHCVVLGLCHFGKRDGADTGKLILGSIAWSQVARSVLSVALDEDSGNLLVTNTKGNLAPRTRSMEARINSVSVDTEDGVTDVGAIEWLGESTRDARDLLGGSDDERDERDEISAVILDYLTERGGSSPASDVLKATRAAGLNDTAVKKARRKAGVRTERQGFGPGASWVWTIDTPIDSIDSHSRERESMESMATGAESIEPRPEGESTPPSGLRLVPDSHLTETDRGPRARQSETTETTGADLHELDETTGEKSQSSHAAVHETTGETTGPESPEQALATLLPSVESRPARQFDDAATPSVRTPGRSPNQWLRSGHTLAPSGDLA